MRRSGHADGRGRRIGAWLVAVALLGCNAGVTRRDGPPIKGRILRSEADALFVRTRDGTERIPCEEVADIDHPGNVLMVLSPLPILNAYVLASWMEASKLFETDEAERRENEHTQEAVLVLGGLGSAALLATGLALWGPSKSRARELHCPAPLPDPVVGTPTR